MCPNHFISKVNFLKKIKINEKIVSLFYESKFKLTKEKLPWELFSKILRQELSFPTRKIKVL